MTAADRRAELAGARQAVLERIARACTAAGRDPAEVTLVAVTKTYPASDVLLLAELGITDVGENRDQEAAPKAAALAAAGAHVRWHFVGQLQRNKARSVARYADVVESVDSIRLAAALDRAAADTRTAPVDVLVQISVDGDPARGGAVDEADDPDHDLWRVAGAVAAADSLRLAGVMAVAPRDWEPDRAFATLAALSARLAERYPGATVVSAGMSGDLEAAVRHGATHVRIGSSLLGMRNTLR
ncbi:YggS family pyridoxal phosphate-dependent enzyme [Krasilnikovia sp. MM14-A1259]|uniref:YggS family pyridoxal phosphate-dependent enzyme n=1 Tax=Krasilnikovia sp. MM14-A1259 TaxID=3373539 RepID=UPI003810741C